MAFKAPDFAGTAASLAEIPSIWRKTREDQTRKETLESLKGTDLETMGTRLIALGDAESVRQGIELQRAGREGKLASHKISEDSYWRTSVPKIQDALNKLGGGGFEVPTGVPQAPPVAPAAPAFPPVSPGVPPGLGSGKQSALPPVSPTAEVPELPAHYPSQLLAAEGRRARGEPEVVSDALPSAGMAPTAQAGSPSVPAPPTPPGAPALPSYMQSVKPIPGAPPPPQPGPPPGPPQQGTGKVFIPSAAADIQKLQAALLMLGPKAPPGALQAIQQQFRHLLSREDYGPQVKEYLFEQTQNNRAGLPVVPFSEWRNQKEVDKLEYTDLHKAYGDIRSKASAADDMKLITDGMKSLIAQPEFVSGTHAASYAAGINRMTSLASILQSHGVDVKDIVQQIPVLKTMLPTAARSQALTEAFKSLENRLALSQLGTLSKDVSNADRDFIGFITPSLRNSAEGNKLIIEMYEKVYNNTKATAKDTRDYLSRQGPKSRVGLDQYLEDQRAKRGPLFVDAEGNPTEYGKRLQKAAGLGPAEPAAAPPPGAPGGTPQIIIAPQDRGRPIIGPDPANPGKTIPYEYIDGQLVPKGRT